MSFTDLKLADLKKVAGEFGVDLPAKVTKNDLILLLEEEGVTYQMYDKFANSDKPEIKVDGNLKPSLEIKNEQTMIVKMERENYTYQVGGITFTKEHPFVALPLSVAQSIFDNHAGFRPATPNEANAYYS